MKALILGMALLAAAPAFAEYRRYGSVELTGLSRDNSWKYNPAGEYTSMVCNVNGRDGFLSIRQGPGTGYAINRNLKRLAIVVVDTSYREGNWVYVSTAYRNVDERGRRLSRPVDLHVSGWAHSGYLCDYLD